MKPEEVNTEAISFANGDHSGDEPPKFYDKRTFMSFMPESINLVYSGFRAYIDKFRNYRSLKREFYRKVNYELDLERPRSYNEKIQWKKLNDRNPLLTVTADKFAVRQYLKEVLGEKAAQDILIPLYYVTEHPETIPFDDLPEKFVVKPNHGSQMHIIVRDKNKISREKIVGECRKWLHVYYGYYTYEWAYRNIKRKIIVEKLIEKKNGELPADYKFYCFHGKCRFIRVSSNRLGENSHTGYFDTDWKLINAGVPGYGYNHPFKKPDNLEKMMKLAEELSGPFDFVRVDLYDLENKIQFGELTHYEASGLARLEPESFDFELGSYWEIKPEYWISDQYIKRM